MAWPTAEVRAWLGRIKAHDGATVDQMTQGAAVFELRAGDYPGECIGAASVQVDGDAVRVLGLAALPGHRVREAVYAYCRFVARRARLQWLEFETGELTLARRYARQGWQVIPNYSGWLIRRSV